LNAGEWFLRARRAMSAPCGGLLRPQTSRVITYAAVRLSEATSLLFAYGMLYPCIRILRAKPRPDRIASVLVGMDLAAFVYLSLSLLIPNLPGSLFVFFAAILLMWTLILRYRSLVLPSLFDSRGGLGTFRERKAVIRQARAAAKLDRQQWP